METQILFHHTEGTSYGNLMQSFYFLSNVIICIFAGALVQNAIKPFILAVSQKACIFEKRNDYFYDHNVYNDLISLLSHENDCILICGESISKMLNQVSIITRCPSQVYILVI